MMIKGWGFTSLSPIAYVCGSQFSRRLNFLYRFLARWPWHPSPNIVTLAWSSMPRSNVGYEKSITNNFKQKLFQWLFRLKSYNSEAVSVIILFFFSSGNMTVNSSWSKVKTNSWLKALLNWISINYNVSYCVYCMHLLQIYESGVRH